jgi:hypothetical protein
LEQWLHNRCKEKWQSGLKTIDIKAHSDKPTKISKENLLQKIRNVSSFQYYDHQLKSLLAWVRSILSLNVLMSMDKTVYIFIKQSNL